MVITNTGRRRSAVLALGLLPQIQVYSTSWLCFCLPTLWQCQKRMFCLAFFGQHGVSINSVFCHCFRIRQKEAQKVEKEEETSIKIGKNDSPSSHTLHPCDGVGQFCKLVACTKTEPMSFSGISIKFWGRGWNTRRKTQESKERARKGLSRFVWTSRAGELIWVKQVQHVYRVNCLVAGRVAVFWFWRQWGRTRETQTWTTEGTRHWIDQKFSNTSLYTLWVVTAKQRLFENNAQTLRKNVFCEENHSLKCINMSVDRNQLEFVVLFLRKMLHLCCRCVSFLVLFDINQWNRIPTEGKQFSFSLNFLSFVIFLLSVRKFPQLLFQVRIGLPWTVSVPPVLLGQLCFLLFGVLVYHEW